MKLSVFLWPPQKCHQCLKVSVAQNIIRSGFFVILCLIAFVHLGSKCNEASSKYIRRSEIIVQSAVTRNPSMKAPLVLVVCEQASGPQDEVQPIRLRGARTVQEDAMLSWKMKGSWLRQAEQLSVLFKSLLYFSISSTWRIIIMTDSSTTFQKVTNITKNFPKDQNKRLAFEQRSVWLPNYDKLDLKKHYRPCVWTKNFLAETLPEEDSVIYLDTDLVFLGPAEELWWLLQSLPEDKALALAPEPQYLMDKPKFTFAGSSGLNTGVLVANLTRLRKLPGGGLGSAMFAAGSLASTVRHDQDALNIFLEHRPHLFQEVTSRWNFLPSSCFKKAPSCPDCRTAGILILHGADLSFYRFIDRKFMVMYDNLVRLHLEEDPRQLLSRIEGQLAQVDYLSHLFPCSNYTGLNQALTLGLVDLTMKNSHLPGRLR